MRILLALTIAAFASSQLLAQANAPSTGSESLGGQLLDDLPGVTKPPATPPQRPQEPAAVDRNLIPPDPEIRFHPLRFDDVGQQEAAQPSGPMRLVRAGRSMAEAEALLRKHSTIAGARQTQDEVVTQLDELIAELSKQCNGNCNNPGNKPPSPSQRSQAKAGNSGSPAGRGNTAARDSNAQLNSTPAKPADQSDVDIAELVKQLWGHLPEREREQMLQSFSDEFLPKYELEIERYYQRLSEERNQAPAR